MLTIDLHAQSFHPLLRERWKNFLLPDVCGIVAGNGTVLLMDESTTFDGTRMRCHVRPVGVRSIESLCDDGMEFIEVTPYTRQAPIPGTRAVALCGEGVMGNEGFVAVVNDHGLVWAIFLSVSNPFHTVDIVDNCVVATSTHAIEWRFPITRPWEIELTYTDNWGHG